MQQETHTATDQLGREISFLFPPKRIVSLVPSQTELLFDLGLSDAIAGVTLFCIHPEEAKQKEKVGGTKKLNLEKIAALRPDLIIANKEENTKEQVEWLSEHFPVWISDIKTLDDSLEMIQNIGALTGKQEAAGKISGEIMHNFESFMPGPPKRTLYLIWCDPWMSIGSDTFINDILERCGLVNILSQHSRYPELTDDMIRELRPDLILLSSEPYPFKEKHIAEIKNLSPASDIRLADGEMFSWYGSRLLKAGDYLKAFLDALK
jgi:ABC-type Fe3+-hydroxamate transport system substrate-binding protein